MKLGEQLNTLPWLLVILTFAESLTIEVSSSITAECGKPVILHCNITSSLTGLSLKHMEWAQSQTYCFVDSEGHLTMKDAEGDFHCHYDKGHLSLHFHKWAPWLSDTSFMCKLRSNNGIRHKHTQVETREHWKVVRAEWGSTTSTCSFKVCPGGEVEWFQDSQRITEQSLIETYAHFESDGEIIISSSLIHSKDRPSNCTLRSSRSGQYLTSVLIHPPPSNNNSAAAQGPLWTSLWILLGFILLNISL